MSWRSFMLIFVGSITAIRYLMLSQMELVPDEAYYFTWARNLDWAYYSKGPGIAMVIAAGTALFGDSEFGVRFFSPLFALITSLLLYALGRRIADERTGALAAILMNLLPIFNVGGLLMTIDPVSIACWSAGLYAFWRVCERPQSATFWWFLTGLATGLGFLAKYTNAIALLSILLLVILTPKLRGVWKRPGIWLMLLTFLACAIPPVIWNAQNDWITVLHLKQRGKLDSAFSFHPMELLEFIGLHLGVYSPLIFCATIFALWVGCRRAFSSFPERFLVLFSLPLLVLYTLLSLKETGEANWTAPAFISLGLLSVMVWLPKLEHSKTWRTTAVIAVLIAGLMSAMVVNTDMIRAAGIAWDYRKDPGGRLRAWHSSALELQKVRDLLTGEMEGRRPFLIAKKYQDAASLAFYFTDRVPDRPGHPLIYIPESQAIQNQFSFYGRYDEFEETEAVSDPEDGEVYSEQKGVNRFLGRDAIFISSTADDERPSTTLVNGFGGWEVLGQLEVKRRGLPARQFRLFLLHDYQTMPL